MFKSPMPVLSEASRSILPGGDLKISFSKPEKGFHRLVHFLSEIVMS